MLFWMQIYACSYAILFKENSKNKFEYFYKFNFRFWLNFVCIDCRSIIKEREREILVGKTLFDLLGWLVFLEKEGLF